MGQLKPQRAGPAGSQAVPPQKAGLGFLTCSPAEFVKVEFARERPGWLGTKAAQICRRSFKLALCKGSPRYRSLVARIARFQLQKETDFGNRGACGDGVLELLFPSTLFTLQANLSSLLRE